MANHERKHKMAFLISVVAFCASVSLIAVVLTIAAPLIAIIVLTTIGTAAILAACRVIESYLVIKNNNKVTSGFYAVKGALTGEEDKLFVEKVFNHLCGFFSKEKESGAPTEGQKAFSKR